MLLTFAYRIVNLEQEKLALCGFGSEEIPVPLISVSLISFISSTLLISSISSGLFIFWETPVDVCT